MAKIKVRYFVAKPGARGPRHYWQPTAKLAKAGWRTRRLHAELSKAIEEAEAINAELDAWYAGTEVAPIRKAEAPKGSVREAILVYQGSLEYKGLKAKTARDYDNALRFFERWTSDGQEMLRQISAPMVKKLYRELYARSPSQANAVMRVMKLLYNFAISEGLADANPVSKIKLKGTSPRVAIWMPHQIALAVEASDLLELPSIGDAVLLAKNIGQRQADVIAHKWVQRQEQRHRIRQQKTATWINVPETPALTARLDAARARLDRHDNDCPALVVSESTGLGYKGDHFRHSFAEVRRAAAWLERNDPAAQEALKRAEGHARRLDKLWFSDLRDTAVTALAEAGCTIPEICSITGHSETSAYGILKHYLALTGEMADSAIAKLVAHEAKQAKKRKAKA